MAKETKPEADTRPPLVTCQKDCRVAGVHYLRGDTARATKEIKASGAFA